MNKEENMKSIQYILALILVAGSAQAAGLDIADDFKNIDKNSDGFIDVEELLAFQKDGLNEQNAQVFKVVDTNSDGEITEEEFIAFYKSKGMEQPESEGDLKTRFAQIDANGDKKITNEEMAQFRNKTVEPENKELFDAMDNDGDHKVSEKEFKQFFEMITAITGM